MMVITYIRGISSEDYQGYQKEVLLLGLLRLLHTVYPWRSLGPREDIHTYKEKDVYIYNT